MEPKPTVERKEQPKTRIVVVEWGQYDDRSHKVLEVPFELNIKDEHKKYLTYRHEIEEKEDTEARVTMLNFVEWLMEHHGAKTPDSVEQVYLKDDDEA